jgi:hypothetical protein
MRNRLSHIEARNKREIAGLLIQLARRIGFRLAPGFGERVVFRELFLQGLTLLDLPEEAPGLAPNPSHLAGRAEIRALLQTIGLSETAPAASAGPTTAPTTAPATAGVEQPATARAETRAGVGDT